MYELNGHCEKRKLALGGVAGREDVVHQGGQLSLGDVDAVVHPLLVDTQSAQRVHRAAQVDRVRAVTDGIPQRHVQPSTAPIDARLELQCVVEPLAQLVAFSRQRHLANAT